MNTKLNRIAKLARNSRDIRFTSLAHLMTPGFLMETWRKMNRRGTSGIDGVTVKEFDQDLQEGITKLHDRLKVGKYRARPVRRVECGTRFGAIAFSVPGKIWSHYAVCKPSSACKETGD